MEEIYIESLTMAGNPLYITVIFNFIQDETIETIRGSKLFWTYEIMNIKAVYHDRSGGPCDYTDYLDDEHEREIEEALQQELKRFKEIA